MYAMTARGLWVALVCGALIFGVGCGGEETPYQAPTGPSKPQDPDQPGQDQYKLQVVGSPGVQLEQGQLVRIQVLYTNHGQAVGGQPIYFAPKGAYADSRLSIYKVFTDAYGFAETVIQAGQLVTTFTVDASADLDGPVQWTVAVVKKVDPPSTIPILEGDYQLTSYFNIKTDFSGSTLAQVLNVLDKISDDPQDPGKFVVDTVLSKVDNQAVLVVAQLLKPTLYIEVNKLLTSIAPQLVADIKQLAQDLSTIARKFELRSTMRSAVAQFSNQPMLVDHRLTKIAWTLNGTRVEYAFTPPVSAEDVQIASTVDGDTLVAEHSFQIKYGVFLLAALNSLIIPQLDPNASDIASLLQGMVDCQKVATTINNTVGAGGQPLWQAACDAGVKAVGILLADEIAKLDNGDSTLIIAGASKLRDMNSDGRLDAFNNGAWTGSLQLDQCIAPLSGAGNTFYGQLFTTP